MNSLLTSSWRIEFLYRFNWIYENIPLKNTTHPGEKKQMVTKKKNNSQETRNQWKLNKIFNSTLLILID